jgi:hypothetical protein
MIARSANKEMAPQYINHAQRREDINSGGAHKSPHVPSNPIIRENVRAKEVSTDIEFEKRILRDGGDELNPAEIEARSDLRRKEKTIIKDTRTLKDEAF